jgi:spore coat protein CotH
MLKRYAAYYVFCLAPILFFQLSSGALFGQTEANALFDDTQVQAINVTMAASDWASLQQNYTANTYYHATMTWNGMSVDFGIRSHGGDGSRSPVKPNLDFNFAHYTSTQTFLGLGFIVLKANNEDPSNLHEWISMKLYRKMGLPAPREAPA